MSRGKSEKKPSQWDALIERSAWVVLVLAVLFALVVRIRLRDMPLERDEGEYAYAGQLLLQGVPPYDLAYNMKLPGTYIAYALIMALLGQSPSGIHLGVAFTNLGTIVMLFFIGRKLLDSAAGAAAALCYAFLSTSPALQGVAGHATHFVVLFALAGVLFLMRACEGNRSANFFLSGLMFGLALLMKQPGGTFGIFALVYVTWRNFDNGKIEWREFARQGGLIATGFALPLITTCIWLLAAGVFKNFLFWCVSYAREYVTTVRWSQLRDCLAFAGYDTLSPTIAFWILAGIGLLGMWWDARLRGRSFFIVGLLLASIVATSAGLYFRPHYFITIAPMLALLGGFAVSRATQQLLHEKSVELFTAFAVEAVFILTILTALFVDGEAWFSQSPQNLSRSMYGSTIFVESAHIAKYIEENSFKDARVAVVGSEPEIYFCSRRRSATGHIYMYGLMGSHPFARKMQDEMIRQISTVQPEWIVYVQDNISWLQTHESDPHIFEWWRSYWTERYNLVRTINILPDAAEQTPQPGKPIVPINAAPTGKLLLFQRKSA